MVSVENAQGMMYTNLLLLNQQMSEDGVWDHARIDQILAAMRNIQAALYPGTDTEDEIVRRANAALIERVGFSPVQVSPREKARLKDFWDGYDDEFRGIWIQEPHKRTLPDEVVLQLLNMLCLPPKEARHA